jgi:hypothetical protein
MITISYTLGAEGEPGVALTHETVKKFRGPGAKFHEPRFAGRGREKRGEAQA